MKKLIAILAALMLLISGCGDSGSDSSNGKDSGKKEEKEVVQLNDAEELPYYSYYREHGDKVSFNKIDKVEMLDITSDISFQIENYSDLPTSEINVLEEEYVVLVFTINGEQLDTDDVREPTLSDLIFEQQKELEFVRGDKLMNYSYEYTFANRATEDVFVKEGGMKIYPENKNYFLMKREYLEDENIQVRLPGDDKWIYFDIER